MRCKMTEADEHVLTGFTRIDVGERDYWFPFIAAEDNQIKVLLPVKDSKYVLIDSADSLIDWFFKAFPDAVIEGKQAEPELVKVDSATDLVCPKCSSRNLFKKGYNPIGRRRYRCKDCSFIFMPKLYYTPVKQSE